MNVLTDVKEASKLIQEGRILLIAGDHELLKQLPKGKWIGGSIPYFMSKNGGTVSTEKLQLVQLPDFVKSIRIQYYTPESLIQIPGDYADHGVSFILIPAESPVHQKYAEEAFNYKGLFDRPLVGWITGVKLDSLGAKKPIVVNGETGEVAENKALVMHVELPKNKIGKLDIVNLFKPSAGEIISFPETGFEATDCMINGIPQNFYDYLISRRVDTKLPLVADYNGASINVSFQRIDSAKKRVHFYAPVFKGIEYSIPNPIQDYEKEFQKQLVEHKIHPTFSCNCILNFLYANLEGEKVGDLVGPITFGEIAYILLNQTMVYLTIVDKE